MEKTKQPTEILDLPSKGYFYSEDNVLSSGKIELLLPTARHEDILTSKKLINNGTVIDYLLESLIVDKNVNYDDLLLIDKDGLTLAARMLLYGANYKTQITCPACQENSIDNFDLSEFESKDIDFSKYTKGINSFSFELPKSKVNIEFKLLTIADEKNINSELKSTKKLKTLVDPEITTRLSFVITKYGNETNRFKIKNIVANEMLTYDSRALRSYIDSISPKIDVRYTFQCDNCGHTQEMDMPIDVQFFWPTNRL